MTDLVQACRDHLATKTDLTALLGPVPADHASGLDPWETWIFPWQNFIPSYQNTQMVGIVISTSGSWQVPNEHNSMRFPRLVVDIWADPTRNADDSMKFDDARDKIESVFVVLNKYLHLTGVTGDSHTWGNVANGYLTILGSLSLGEPNINPIREGNGGYMGRCYYGVNTV